MFYQSIKDKKKLIEKIKRCCTAMSKFNLNSPCLLQFVRINGEYEVIISHNPVNGDRMDFYKIFSTVTKDSFYISEEDKDCFKCADDRVSVPLIVTTYNFINPDLAGGDKNLIYYTGLKYDFCIDSFYIYPKFVLKAIKEEKISDFLVMQRSFIEPLYAFNMDIIYDIDDPRYKYTLFIRNSEKLDYLYNLSIFPFGLRKTDISDLYMEFNKDCVSYLHLDKDLWVDTFEANRYRSCIPMKGANNESLLIYHHDFMQKKLVNARVTKRYESIKGNIATLYFNVELPNSIHEYFKYKYYDIGY